MAAALPPRTSQAEAPNNAIRQSARPQPAEPAPAAGGENTGSAGVKASKCCPSSKLSNRWTAMGLCVLVYASFCFIAAFTRGWYTVTYSPSPVVDACSLPLWDCSLAACKPEDTHTGYQGEGECDAFMWGQIFFILAALYALCYLLFTSGILSGETKKWTNGDFSGCCLTSTEARPPCMPEGRVLPHGVLLCGTPFLMMLGLICIMAQDKTEFDGMEEGMGGLFWVAVVMTVFGFGICAFNGRAQILLASTTRLLPPRPLPRDNLYSTPGAENAPQGSRHIVQSAFVGQLSDFGVR